MGLIEKNDNGSWKLKGVGWSQIKPGAVITVPVWEKLYGALWKLKDYEETGLSPDQVSELQDETQEQARQMLERVARLSDEIEQLKHGGDPGIKFFINKDGVADVYDDTYDIVIHCESEEDQKDAKEALKEIRRWIPVTEKLPEPETYILVSFDNFTLPDIATYRVDDDGSGAFYPGDEDYTYLSVGFYVNAWMPLPEPYRAELEEN
ncbi:DUF551 domain-containing protein [Clostridium sp. AM22-16AC]|nr:DUF551 domain-containing protein [Clostridium sp. AM22-16AC]RHO03307.1 DUF551 domain-containing protein [Clostridium sp. AM22-16AC]